MATVLIIQELLSFLFFGLFHKLGLCLENALGIVAILILQLVVNLNDILDQQDKHHQQLVDNTDNDGSQDHSQQALAGKAIAPVGGLEQHKEAGSENVQSEKNVAELQNLLDEQELEVEQIMHKPQESIQLSSCLLGSDEDQGHHSATQSKDQCNDIHHTGTNTKNTHKITSKM